MYLIGVDRSWLHTPFLRHKLKIKDQAEIDALLRTGIAQVTIDTELGLDVVELEPIRSASIEPVLVERSPVDTLQASVASSHPPAAMLAENLAKATQRRTEWVRRLNSLFEQARKTGLLQQDIVSQVIPALRDKLERLLARPASQTS